MRTLACAAFALVLAACTGESDPNMLLRNAVWNSWAGPWAIHYSDSIDRTYYGGVGLGGEVRIGAYNHASGAIETAEIGTTETDDHCAPSLVFDASGVLWAFYSLHNSETTLYYRQASSAESIGAWESEQTLTWSGNVTYPQPFLTSSGRIIVFVRLSNNRWAHRYTDDGGSTWSSEQQWLATETARYEILRQHADPDVLTVGVSYHPTTGSQNDIYLARIDLDTGDVTVPGDATSLADIYDSGTLPFEPETDGAIKAYTGGSGETVRMWSVSRNDEIAFSTWDGSDLGTAQYQYVQVASDGTVGTVRTLVSPGSVLDSGEDERGFFGQMHLSEIEGDLLLARESSGDWMIERWTTDDGGASWSSERLDRGDVGHVVKRLRPIAPVDAHSDLPAVWLEGEWGDPDPLDDYRTNIVGGLDMAITLSDRVRETTTTTGTGTVDLGGAETGFQTLVSGHGDGAEVFYTDRSGAFASRGSPR